MSLETFTGKIADLVVTNPQPTDPKSEGDDHLRGIKYTLQQTFPGFDGPLNATRVPFTPAGNIAANNVQAALQEVDTETQAGLNTKVSKSGDTMTGQLNGITPVAAANLTRKDYVDGQIRGPVFSGFNASIGAITNNTPTKLMLSTVELDTNSCWNAGLTRFIPNVAGYYRVSVIVSGVSDASTLQLAAAQIWKNGASVGEGSFTYEVTTTVGTQRSVITRVIQMNGTTDYIEPAARVVGGGNLSVSNFNMDIEMVRRA